MTNLTKWASLLLAFLLCACNALNPADVAADRDRWAAVTAVTADGTIDASEKPVFDAAMAGWDQKLIAAEAAVAQGNATAQDLIRAYGLAAVQLWLVPEMQKTAPELFRLADRNGDNMLDEAEILSIDPKSPAFAAVVLTTAARLIARK